MGLKFAVIGSNSFSGASFVDNLLKNEYETIGISRSSEPDDVFLPYRFRARSNFTFYRLDINKDLDEIVRVITNFKPHYIVNFAAQSMVGESWLFPEDWFSTNTVSTIKLHDRLRRLDFLRKYVHISTPEVYGSCEGFVSESTNYNPSTPYAVSRAAADMNLINFYQVYDFPVVITRAANVYGPGQQLYRIIPRAILYFILNKKLQLHGGGKSTRSFIHIEDVSDCTLLAALNAHPPEIYHISTKRTISIRDLVYLISQQLNVSFEENVEIAEDRLGKDAYYLLDSQKARNELGWHDKIALENGIEDTILWVKNNLNTLKKQPFNYIHKK